MRLDGYLPHNPLPGRGIRPVQAGEIARTDQPAGPRVEVVRNAEVRNISASTAVAEYIPARRDSIEPVHGRVGQALASYNATAHMVIDDEVEGVFGIDLYS